MSFEAFPARHLFAQTPAHLGELPGRLARAYGDQIACQIREGAAYRRYTFREFEAGCQAMACRLAAAGVGPSDRVVISGDNTPEWLMGYFAVVMNGAIAVPMDPALAPGELKALSAHCQAKAALVSERLLSVMEAALGPERVTALAPEAFRPGTAAFDAVAGAASSDIAAILYTSGTTGHPKGVMLTHRNLLFDVEACASVLYIKPNEVYFCLLPLHHAYAFTCALIAMVHGVPSTYPASLKPDAIVAAMVETRVTAMAVVPLLMDHLALAIQERLEALPPRKRRAVKLLISLSAVLRPLFGAGVSRRLCAPILSQLGGVRTLISGGAALSVSSAEFFHSLGVTVMNGYGLTETAPVVTLTPSPWRPGDGVGKPLAGVEVAIAEADASGIGEVLVRGPNVMAGYYREIELTAAAFQDAWFKTGDLGRLDASGALHLAGRSRSVIVLPSGKNVYPEDLEGHYGQSPLIAEMAVVRGREEDGREFPFGVIVASAEARQQAADELALNQLIRGELNRLSRGLADYKRLKRFELTEDPLPRTSSRKLKRHVLDDAYRFDVEPATSSISPPGA